MGKRLLDWFKVIQDQAEHPHVIQKRNSKKKELHEQGYWLSKFCSHRFYDEVNNDKVKSVVIHTN